MTPAPVLIVEDDADLRDLMATVVAGDGYSVTTAYNGEVALERVNDNHPLLILLDMRMPVMDGWSFARAYRSLPGPHAPIIVVTAAQSASAWASEIGAVSHLGKPFDLDELIQLVHRHAPAGV